jgi:hypothetical protein
MQSLKYQSIKKRIDKPFVEEETLSTTAASTSTGASPFPSFDTINYKF